jgi:L-alanine-DL-glutamate epimerase-like enolase superfamily enzyme
LRLGADRTFLMRHVGSQALRAFVDAHQPDLVICGHIHEARGIDRIAATQVVNCGLAAAGSYAVVEVAASLAIELRKVWPGLFTGVRSALIHQGLHCERPHGCGRYERQARIKEGAFVSRNGATCCSTLS